jgi:hypothetical protein
LNKGAEICTRLAQIRGTKAVHDSIPNHLAGERGVELGHAKFPVRIQLPDQNCGRESING